MPLPKGWHYQPGTGRTRVLDPQGGTHTRQHAENTFAQRLGAKSDYDLRNLRKAARARGTFVSPRYREDLKRARAAGKMSDAEFRNLTAVLSGQRRSGKRQSRSTSVRRQSKGAPSTEPGGPLAQYLYATGRRGSPIDYSVGETPDAA